MRLLGRVDSTSKCIIHQFPGHLGISPKELLIGERMDAMSKYSQLSQEERYILTSLKRSGRSLRQIAREMNRSLSTIIRELRRNLTHHDGGYRAEVAHSYAVARRRRVRRGSHYTEAEWDLVISLLEKKFSPDQISHVLKQSCLLSISHETIYRYIRSDRKKGGLLFKHLRIMPKCRRKRYKSRDSRGILPGKKHISIRPTEVEDRKAFGHWEGDTVIGPDKHNCIVTLVERKTGYVVIKKVTSRTAKKVTLACSQSINEQAGKIKTITFDNGTEFHQYKVLEDRYGVQCYFATPHHSWERGTNENTNGLIRQYIPKKTCMSKIDQAYCDWVAGELNNRPRKRLGYKTPKDLYSPS